MHAPPQFLDDDNKLDGVPLGVAQYVVVSRPHCRNTDNELCMRFCTACFFVPTTSVGGVAASMVVALALGRPTATQQ